MALAMIDIANEALRLMGDSEVNSLEDGSAQSARIKAAWKGCVEYLLSRHPWSFALRRVALARVNIGHTGGSSPRRPPHAAAGQSPATSMDIHGYPYAYAIPADTMRVVAVFAGEGAQPLPLGSWTQEAGHILCHAPSVLCLHVFRNMDVSTWAPGFCATVAAYLAFVTSRPLSRTEMTTQFEQLYRQRLDAARLDDSAHEPCAPAHAVMTSVMAARLGHEELSGVATAPLGYALTMEGLR